MRNELSVSYRMGCGAVFLRQLSFLFLLSNTMGVSLLWSGCKIFHAWISQFSGAV